MSPGGGGWGDPLDRDPEAVAVDVMRDLVSLEKAESDYGVILASNSENGNFEVDADATAAKREDIRSSRNPLQMFDRGEKFYDLVREGEINLTSSDEELEVVT